MEHALVSSGNRFAFMFHSLLNHPSDPLPHQCMMAEMRPSLILPILLEAMISESEISIGAAKRSRLQRLQTSKNSWVVKNLETGP